MEKLVFVLNTKIGVSLKLPFLPLFFLCENLAHEIVRYRSDTTVECSALAEKGIQIQCYPPPHPNTNTLYHPHLSLFMTRS